MNEEDDTYNGNEGVDLSSWSFVISYTPQDAFISWSKNRRQNENEERV